MSGLRQSELNNIDENSQEREKLLTLKEAAEILELSEEETRYFVAAGKVPAYKIGGKFLRFKRDQVEALRDRIKILRQQSVPIERISVDIDDVETDSSYTVWDHIRDFIRFNDFYILAAIFILALVFIIFNK